MRFANTDATFEGFDRNKRFHLVCEINPNWYHRIFHPQGNDSVELAVLYDPSTDGNWDAIAHWQNVPEWQAVFHENQTTQSPFLRMAKTTWSNFSYSPFALAITSEPFAVAGVDTIIWKYDTIQLQASGGIGYQSSPGIGISCDGCVDTLAYPLESTLYRLNVSDSKGCTDFDGSSKNNKIELFMFYSIFLPKF